MGFAFLLLLGLLLPLAGAFGGDGDGDGDDGRDGAGDDDPQDDAIETTDLPDPEDTPTDEDALAQYRSGPQGGYNVDVAFEGDWSRDQQQAVIDAADYISEIVLADLPAEDGVDDLAVTARLLPIDGPAGIAGRAGPTDLRAGTLLPHEGVIELDAADADPADPGFDDVVLHEMLHAMGFGTTWTPLGLVETDGAGDPRYVGANGQAAYGQAFPFVRAGDARADEGVPLDPGGQHWDEARFGDEVMTPLGVQGQDEAVSLLTIASLEDLGYDTVFDDPEDPDDRRGPFTGFA